MPPRTLGILRAFLFLLFSIAAIALIRDTLENGHDFLVFWKGATAVLHGEDLYSLSRDGGMVFKYPPWILSFFIPFGFLSLGFAKFCWGLINVVSLAAIVYWIRVQGCCRDMTWVAVLIAYWGLWAVHALDGQIALVMLAVALWAWVPGVFEKSRIRSFFLVFALSTKIFTLFPLLQNRFSKKLLRRFFGVLGILLLLSLPALVSTHSRNPVSLFLSWKEAATSGGALLTTEQIRGRYNPSLTNLILRLLHVPANQPWADVGMACLFGLLLALYWRQVTRRMLPLEAWVGWLALAPVIHPLPWWHLFVFSFPLAVVSLDRALKNSGQNQSLAPTGFALLGIALICGSTEKLLGSLGLFLEMSCAKSWGVLLCATVLAYLSEINSNKINLTKST